jgi:hypothetical protein
MRRSGVVAEYAHPFNTVSRTVILLWQCSRMRRWLLHNPQINLRHREGKGVMQLE